MTSRRLLPAALLATFAVASAAAAGISDWRPAPLYGADVRSLVFDPARPERAFAGTSGGHVYRSDDGGASWRNAGAEAPFAGFVVGTLIFDPNRPQRLWAGLWGIWGGGLVAFSDDAGGRWTFGGAGLPVGDEVYAVAPVPGVADRLFVGTRTGVWVSSDAGAHFSPASSGAPELVHVSSLLAGDERTLLAGTWRRAYRSDDGGGSWHGVFDGMVLDTEVFSLHAVPGSNGEVWASTCGWIYHGDELGARWRRVEKGLAEKRTPSFRVLSADRLLAGTIGGAFLSTDGGLSFRRTSDADLAVLSIASHPAHPERVLIGTEGAGVWLSTDGGESFAPRLVGMINVRVPAISGRGDEVFAALAHAGPYSGVFRSPDEAASFEPRPAELPTVLGLAATADRLWAATEKGLWVRQAGGWSRVPELGEARVVEVVAEGERVAARTARAVFERDRGGFRATLALPGDTTSIALWHATLWIGRADGLARRGAKGLEPVATPFAHGRVTTVGPDLVWSGDGGIARRADPAAPWIPLSERAGRALATGSFLHPLLVVGADGVELFDRQRGALMALAVPFAPRDVLSAAAVGDRLLVGTSGYGLWSYPLPEPSRASAASAASMRR
ncbi:MAG: hypothetical protein U0X73_14115 [Thermoanaerobaculia bacterium]